MGKLSGVKELNKEILRLLDMLATLNKYLMEQVEFSGMLLGEIVKLQAEDKQNE